MVYPGFQRCCCIVDALRERAVPHLIPRRSEVVVPDTIQTDRPQWPSFVALQPPYRLPIQGRSVHGFAEVPEQGFVHCQPFQRLLRVELTNGGGV